jgi:glycosyltransferase involved in cell wall biosynthesis
LPRRPRGNAARFAALAERTLDPRAEVVVCDYAWPASCLAPRLAARGGPPCVVNGRGSDVLQVAGEAGLGAELGRNLRASSGWCAVSEDLVRAMDRIAASPGRGLLVPNGVDLELFQVREREAARVGLGLDPAVPLVLVVGHWIERKDPLLALRAFAAGAPPEARLAFLGRGPLEGALREASQRLGLEARVRLVGERSPEELARWYSASDLVLLTSRREGRPNVVLEALASGRPVLATDAGGTAELLPDSSWLLASREADEIGRRLADCLSARHDSHALRATVAHLTWEASFERLEAWLESCRARAGSAGAGA